MTLPPSRLGATYERLYTSLCGRHPRVRICHHQWLAGKDLYRDLGEILPTLRGHVLDVGCGNKPYVRFLHPQVKYKGLDVQPGPDIDLVVDRHGEWPLEAASFDAVICTQVMEHVEDFRALLNEIKRVVAPGGSLLVTVPFIYNEHGSPHDYHRFSLHGARQLFVADFEIVELKTQGGIGSTVGLLMLNWVDASANKHAAGRYAKALLLPVWMLCSTFINTVGWIFDKIDRTDAFYSNVLVLARKRAAES